MASSADGLRSVHDYQVMAEKLLPEPYLSYYTYPSLSRQTYRDSLAAFSRYRFLPRTLSDVSRRCLSTTVLGQPISIPIGASPTAIHSLAHKDAEIATAKGVAAANTVMIQSCYSNKTIPDVAASAPDGLRWMQTYLFKDRRIVEHIIRTAEVAGHKAIVFTVDSPMSGLDSGYDRDFELFNEEQQKYSNIDIGLPEFKEARKQGARGIVRYHRNQFDPSLTWDDVKWFRRLSTLPIVCKGILTAEAARQAADAGVDGILVSAHGGRQLDGVPAPIDALAEVVEAVRGRNVEVYMDGGVRTGADVLKALARGAKAVFIGRPILWGLTCRGSSGVQHVFDILQQELDYAMALCGCSDVNSIPSDIVVHESYYHVPKHRL
ncbi:2-Hydroxyacid oxidase 1-like [Diadema antillarum]|uniref:2-Hydroxyacid oxidase 1-like n=1 Tax=Diadema antillarum TaxID=105358 RepID=UPI003A86B538